MPKDTPRHLPATDTLDQWRQWRPEAQQRALELLNERADSTWRPFYCANRHCDGKPHDDGWTWPHARADQHPPRWADDWLTLLLSGGRGSGKTRAGSEITHRVTNKVPRIILVGATGPDLRDTMVEGESGILACSPPGKRPLWEPSKKKLTWPNGCVALGFSAEEPDRLRGPQHGFAWADEPAHYPLAQQVWDNMLFGLRMKHGFTGPIIPKVVGTSTPKPTRFVKDLIGSPSTVVHRVSTYANLDNLADTFKQTILDRYEGTRLGRQELHGEVLADIEGALWTWDMFDWVDEPPDLIRVVVGVDPAGSANARSDETGILTVGISADQHYYVLDDSSGRYSPEGWGTRANGCYETFHADAIVPEKNYGGDMVRFTLENSGYTGARIKLVDSRRGKTIRAEPVVALYEKHRVHHVGRQGDLGELEDELTTWVPGDPSPNRLDALVHALTALARQHAPAQVADPTTLPQRAPINTTPRLRVVS